MAGLRLVVGLGNPGREYARTRHNAGFMVVDALARDLGVDGQWKSKDGSLQVLDRTHGVVLAKPQSFMNASGEPTQRLAAWYKIPPASILAVVDDLDLPLGKLRLRERGSSGGHNGLKSLIAHFGPDFPRLRIGIGRDGASETIDYVLGKFSVLEEARLEAIVAAAVEGTRLWMAGSSVTAINFINSWAPKT